jgi:hypothetical protein
MTRLVYTLERKTVADRGANARLTSQRSTSEDALIAMTVAALGLPLLRRHANASGECATVTVTFPDDRVMAVFNLRVERALAIRNIRIRKIEVAAESMPVRAVA